MAVVDRHLIKRLSLATEDLVEPGIAPRQDLLRGVLLSILESKRINSMHFRLVSAFVFPFVFLATVLLRRN